MVAALVACASSEGRTILVVGDSLSAGFGIAVEEGWVALLQQRLDAEDYGYTVVNASISGDTTGGGARRIERALEIHQPDIVIIELGGNDALRGTPVLAIRTNLRTMIRASLAADARVVLAGIQIPPNYGRAYTESFAALYPEMAESFDVALIDFFMAGVALNDAYMQSDGIHPNAAGQPILLDNVWPVLKPLL